MIYEGVWIEQAERDLENLPVKDAEKLLDKFEDVLTSPNTKTKRVMHGSENIRKIRQGNYRLFILIREDVCTVYALCCVSRKDAYKYSALKEMDKLVRRIIQAPTVNGK